MVQSVQNMLLAGHFDCIPGALKPSVCIFGAGAVGQFLAVFLEQHCRSLTLCCSASTCRNIKDAGRILIKDIPRQQDIAASKFKVLDSSNLDDDLEEFDAVFSCAKAHHLPAALPVLKRLVGPDTLLVTIQNGLPFHHGHLTTNRRLNGQPLLAVDPAGALFAAFERHQVVSGVVYVAAERTGPAEVTCRSTPKVTKFMFGKVPTRGQDGSRVSCTRMYQALQAVVNGLVASGVNASIEDDILSIIWQKLLDSSIINPTNALTHGAVDALVKSNMMTPLIEGLAEEVMAVGVAVGARYEWSTAAEWRSVCAARFPPCKFSMLQDVEAGRQMEVAPLVAAVADVARALEIATPRLDTLVALISHYNANLDVQRGRGGAVESAQVAA